MKAQAGKPHGFCLDVFACFRGDSQEGEKLSNRLLGLGAIELEAKVCQVGRSAEGPPLIWG